MQSREILRSKGPRDSHQRVIPNLLRTQAHKFKRTEKLKTKKSPEIPPLQRNKSLRAIKVRPSFVNSSEVISPHDVEKRTKKINKTNFD